ncbi:protein phosphatase 2C domain-containing protein [Streptomyces huasconensis]|uniref:protein phosphatase 2C domain-containing protein n=1 Tax=Streptomyces huasconensis TaxID=1854574 RepID=UPI0036F5F685
MSQQGERRTGRDDDWWGQLYDDATQDTGPAPAPDTLDDRFASAADAVSEERRPLRPERPPPAPEFVPAPPRTPPRPERAPADAPPSANRPAPPPPPASPTPAAPPTPPDPPTPPRASASPAPPKPSPRAPSVPAARRAPWEPLTGPRGPVTFGAGAGVVAGAGEEAPGVSGAGQVSVPSPGPTGPDHVGDGPPTYEAEPTALPAADPDDLGDLIADTVLDGARYGTSTLRAASVRGDSARFRGEPRRDSLLTARFGVGEDALVLVAMATGARAAPGAHRAAADACAWIGRAVGRSHQRLAEDIRAARRGDLKSGLHRLTDRTLGKLRARATDLGLAPDEYAASLRCLLLPADPRCRTRVFFGVGAGGLFRLRDGAWQDIEPRVAEATGDAVVGFGSPPARTPEGDHLTMDLGITTPPSPYEPAPEPPRDPFRFRASVARPGDTLLLCSGGLADPLRGEPALAEHLTDRWLKGPAPGLAAFLADIQVRVKGYADDRTAAAVWEA